MKKLTHSTGPLPSAESSSPILFCDCPWKRLPVVPVKTTPAHSPGEGAPG